jgi:hypothetical protein
MNQSAAVVVQRGLRPGRAGSGQVGREKLGLARGRLGRSVLGDGGAATARRRGAWHGRTGVQGRGRRSGAQRRGRKNAPGCRGGVRRAEERVRRAGVNASVQEPAGVNGRETVRCGLRASGTLTRADPSVDSYHPTVMNSSVGSRRNTRVVI